MRRVIAIAPQIIACLAALRVGAQQPDTSRARAVLPSTADQIAAAVTPLPQEMRAGATVLGYAAIGKPLIVLRDGRNNMICLAPDPTADTFHAACYHKAMEPFMARGRELRAQGVRGPRVDTVRFAEVKSGKLKLPVHPAMLYQVFGGKFDAATGTVPGGQSYFVIYVPFGTTETTGITATQSAKDPWLMWPGTPKAHIMMPGSKM